MLFLFAGMVTFTAEAKTEIQKQEIRGDTVTPEAVQISFLSFEETPAPEFPPGLLTEKGGGMAERKTEFPLHIDPG